MYKRFKALEFDDIVIYTIIVCLHLMRFYKKEVEFTMIIEKAKNFILRNSQKEWDEIMKVYNEFYNLKE